MNKKDFSTNGRKRPSVSGQGPKFGNGTKSNHGLNIYAAAANTLAQELAVVLLAADRMAAGHTLVWDDYCRLHNAHQHVLAVLTNLMGRG